MIPFQPGPKGKAQAQGYAVNPTGFEDAKKAFNRVVDTVMQAGLMMGFGFGVGEL